MKQIFLLLSGVIAQDGTSKEATFARGLWNYDPYTKVRHTPEQPNYYGACARYMEEGAGRCAWTRDISIAAEMGTESTIVTNSTNLSDTCYCDAVSSYYGDSCPDYEVTCTNIPRGACRDRYCGHLSDEGDRESCSIHHCYNLDHIHVYLDRTRGSTRGFHAKYMLCLKTWCGGLYGEKLVRCKRAHCNSQRYWTNQIKCMFEKKDNACKSFKTRFVKTIAKKKSNVDTCKAQIREAEGEVKNCYNLLYSEDWSNLHSGLEDLVVKSHDGGHCKQLVTKALKDCLKEAHVRGHCTGANEEVSMCAPRRQQNCNDATENQNKCKIQCVCKPGYIREASNTRKCVQPTDCPSPSLYT